MDSTTTYSVVASLLIILALTAGGYFAYEQGYLDSMIEKMGVIFFKAKAVAEAKEMQAKGMKAGEDFVGCKSCPFASLSSQVTKIWMEIAELKGNQQANEVKEGLGAFGGLKKDL